MTRSLSDSPSTASLVAITRRYSVEEAQRAGWTLTIDGDGLSPGDIVLVPSAGALRRGIITNLARAYASVAFITESAIRTAGQVRTFGVPETLIGSLTVVQPRRTSVKVPFDQVWTWGGLGHYVQDTGPTPVGAVLLRTVVTGSAMPKGSQKVITARGRKPVMKPDNPESAWWQRHVAITVQQDARCPGPGWPTLLPVQVSCVFLLGRAFSCEDEEPTGHDIGDVDKLCRNVGDALEMAGLIKDDKQVITWDGSYKAWAPGGVDPCMLLTVSEYR